MDVYSVSSDIPHDRRLNFQGGEISGKFSVF